MFVLDQLLVVTTVTLLLLVVAVKTDTPIMTAQPYNVTQSKTIDSCTASLTIVPYSHTRVTFNNSKQGPALCFYEIATTTGHHIVLTFNPTFKAAIITHEKRPSRWCQNTERFIQIQRNTKPSFYFCDNFIPPQFVTVNHSVSVSVYDPHNITVDFIIEALPTVACSREDEFQCSTVECIPKMYVCDDVEHCSNMMDEYCDYPMTVRNMAISTTGSREFFQCDNHEYIRPIESVYETRERYWWLCDNYEHCPDGTDEQHDVCHNLVNRSEGVFRCMSGIIAIPMKKVCNSVVECYTAADETSCSPVKVTNFTALPPSTRPLCFLCRNGECIQPVWSVYTATWVSHWLDKFWWLCDGFNHCSDGTDEDQAQCNDWLSRSEEIYPCEPEAFLEDKCIAETSRSDLVSPCVLKSSPNNHLVHILRASVCDWKDDCMPFDWFDCSEDPNTTMTAIILGVLCCLLGFIFAGYTCKKAYNRIYA